ncbi:MULTISPECIES: hypothetical protein [Stenotrophomonas]|uniref:hypothetical protein n=1 Tax=Stenotrophomonas TaxID=40323 RepID=UPI000A2FFC1B|nr:hypothetical protein [Stenotrophomonas maltophilia]ARQ91501.1 hypothetical protein A7326_18565 [Stenotrophomonas maltophilia]
MRDRFRLPPFWMLATAQLLIALLLASAWFYVNAKGVLAGPPNPDQYVNTWGFQMAMFLFYWMPAVLLFMGILLGIERSALAPRYARQKAAARHSDS